MTALFSDTTTGPILIPSGKPVTPFTKITLNETTFPATENVSVKLGPGYSYPNGVPVDLGSLSDPLGGGSYNATTHLFKVTTIATGTPTSATAIIQRLVYIPPALAAGSYETVNALIFDNDLPVVPYYFPDFGNTHGNTVQDYQFPVLETVTPPAITRVIASEPVASGATLRPFASVRLVDYNLSYDARDVGTVTLTDAAGSPTDADGLLTGPSLGKIGVGTYALVAASYYDFQTNLHGLVFTPAAVADGSTRTTTLGLHVSDVVTTLATDETTSALVIGPTVVPTPPLIAGTTGDQTVVQGDTISPFNGVTVSDTNVDPQDSATLTVSGGGTLSGTGLVAGSAGVYTIAVTSPVALTAILDKITFTAPPLGEQPSVTSTIKLDVVDRTQAASDSKTTIKEIAELQLPPFPVGRDNFLVADQTTGQQSVFGGDIYSGPVLGLHQQLILITPDNLKITTTFPNFFIHSGDGDDYIDVSRYDGNNVLDGSTGSNVLVGGRGRDTFFVDDRNPASDVFSTVVNFHSGDNATIFGVDATTSVAIRDNQGAAGAKGLIYTFTAAGKPNASIVIAGFSIADLANGRLTASYGTNADLPGQPGSGGVYLNIHGNS